MKKNTLALISAASLAALLSACGGSGSGAVSSNSGSTTSIPDATSNTPTPPTTQASALPVSWNGTWVLNLAACTNSFSRADSAGGGNYYVKAMTTTVNPSQNEMTMTGALYNDDQCTSSAGSFNYVYDMSQVTPSALEGYGDVRNGLITATDIQLTQGEGDPAITPTFPEQKGTQSRFLGGINTNGELCTTASKQEKPTTLSGKFCAQKQQ